MISTVYAVVAFLLLALAVRARYERRGMAAWGAREGVRAAAEMRALKTVMYPDGDSLAKRETDWYVNRLGAAVMTRPGVKEAV